MSWRGTVQFYTQLRSLLRAGIAIDRACDLSAEHAPPPYRRWGREWAAGCRAGRPLAEQMRRVGERPLPCAVIAAGEHSGRLVALCDEIVAFYEAMLAVRGTVVARSVYPIVLFHAATVIPVVPLWFLGGVTGWAALIGPAILWGGLGGAWGAWRLGVGSTLGARLAVRWPLRALLRPLSAAIICQVLHAGAAAGLLWPAALRLAADTCGNEVLADRLRRAATGIERGAVEGLAAALQAADLPREVVELCATAEEAGELEVTLQRAATLQRERFRARAEWTARIATGLIYALAMALAVVAILVMIQRFYLGPISETLESLR